MDIISLVASCISIVLGVYAIWFAQKESKASTENYDKTKELLNAIEHKTELIDRGIQFQQNNLTSVINKILDISNKSNIDSKPLSLEEINDLIEGKNKAAQEQVKKIEETVSNLPRIYVGNEHQKDAKEGDIILQIV